MPFSELSLADCAAYIVDNRGKTCPVGNSGLPLIATNCLRDGGLYPTYETSRFVSQETYETWFRGHPQPGDLIFVTKGTPGRVCLAPDPVDFCIAQDMVAIRADERKVYPRYLFAVLRSDEVQRRISNMHVGTLIPHFKKGDFDKLLLPIPRRQEQVFIGDMYFEVSARIHLLQRTNITLESVAQALFKSWFIDFDPVRAKVEGREPQGMDAATAALFPAEFDDLVLMPKGWKIGSILDVASLLSGGTPKTNKPDYWGGKVPWASAKDVSQSSDSVLVETERTITEAGLAESSTRLIPALATAIVARGATTGRMVMFGREMAMNQTCYALVSRHGTPATLYLQLRNEIGGLLNAAHGSVFDTITTTTFARSQCVVAPVELRARFEQLVRPLFDKVVASVHQAQTLAALRDDLLPRLVSGKLRRPDAEAQLEDALA